MASMFNVDRQGNRQGFTLVELLVVIAIIGILVSLLLPSVNAARESARRLQCLSQIRQLGIAVVNFESTNSRLPPGGLLSPIQVGVATNCEKSFNSNVSDCFDAFGVHGGPTYSWMVLILPFLEEAPLYDEFDFQTSIYELPTRPQSTTVSSFLCPTDNARVSMYDGAGTPIAGQGIRFAKGNYAAYVSPVHLNMQRILPAAFGGFDPGDAVGQRMARVKDGTSNTLAITEVRTLDRDWDSRGAWSLPFPGASLLALDWHPHANRVEAPYRPNSTYPLRFVQTPNGTGLPDQLVDCSQPAYASRQKMRCQRVSYFSSAPRSRHLGGVTCVALDTHAGFVSDDIDSYVFAYLISANDGQVSSVSEYLR
jgi:prepilin-type N-terminal cleavage/methylation domain-containing protein